MARRVLAGKGRKMTKKINYQDIDKSYKYVLTDELIKIKLPDVFRACNASITDRYGHVLALLHDGIMKILKGYAWDGASFIAIDTKDFMFPSLVHDILYQMMRDKKINSGLRKESDKLLRKHCRDCGMGRFRAWYVYEAVRIGGGSRMKSGQHSAPAVDIVT